MPATLTAEQREKRRAICLSYYERNKEKCQAASKRWWNAHPEKLRAKWRRSSQKNKVKRAVRHKAWRLENLESARAKNRDWQSKNWKHRQDYIREYIGKHAQELKEKHRTYWRGHRGKSATHSAHRRALIKASTVNLSKIEGWIDSVLKKKTVICYWCGCKIPSTAIHFDHVVALSKGGPHSVENLCVACAPCNLSKHDKDAGAWIRIGQQVFSL